MSFSTTPFRPLTRAGFGVQMMWRGNGVSTWATPNNEAGNSTELINRGQLGTVVYIAPAGFSNHSLSGVTRDSTGAVLSGCRVDLCQGNIIKGTMTSDGSGNFTFLGPGSGPFFLVAYKVGSPDVAGTTVNTLQPTVV